MEWPDAVFGCAISTERTFLPAAYEADLPADADAAAQIVASHPERQEIRVVVGVDRFGNRHGVARLASRPEELLGGGGSRPRPGCGPRAYADMTNETGQRELSRDWLRWANKDDLRGCRTPRKQQDR